MKSFPFIAATVFTLLAAATASRAQEMPEMPTPAAEHEWLQKFVGSWESVAECSMGPDQPPMKNKGTHQGRMLGGFWVITEGSGEAMGVRYQSILTLGYDPRTDKYVGTWTDSLNDFMFHYQGTLDDSGKRLTLMTEGPNLMADGEMADYRDTIEFKSNDHYVMTSSLKNADGEWETFMTADFRRVK